MAALILFGVFFLLLFMTSARSKSLPFQSSFLFSHSSLKSRISFSTVHLIKSSIFLKW